MRQDSSRKKRRVFLHLERFEERNSPTDVLSSAAATSLAQSPPLAAFPD